MITIVESRWCERGKPRYEAIELHSTWGRRRLVWLIDQQSVRSLDWPLPKGWKFPFAVRRASIKHLAAVHQGQHAFSLLMFSKTAFPTRRVQPDSQTPFELREPEYIELGTTFSGSEAAKMIAGIRRLGYQLLEFSWPELLDRIHRRAVVE